MWAYCSHLMIGLGVFGIFSGTITAIFYDDLYHYIMKQQMAISNGSYSYDLWVETPIDMYMKVYYFDCVNAEDVMATDAKPLLKQVGPYTFREHHKKTDIVFSPDGNLVDFKSLKTWYFEPDMSNGTLDDEIWTLNMIAISAAEATRWPGHWAADDYPFMQFMMDQSIIQGNETMFMRVRIGNLTFEGIDSPLLHMGDLGGDIGAAINASIPYDRFGWFYSRNESTEYDGVYQMHTGKDDIYKVGQISEWQGYSNLSHLYPEPCDGLYGSAGEFFPQDRDKTSISYFTPDLCRPIFFNFKEKTEVSGIHGYKYWLDSMFIGNSTTNATNTCYNSQPDLVIRYPYQYENFTLLNETVNMPLIDGLLNVSACKFDSAAYVSFPHYYLADPILLEQFDERSDLNPNEDEHSSYLSIMPKQGIPLEVAIRMQINILYRPLKYVTMLQNVTPTFYPAVWFEVTTELPADMAGQLRMLEWVPRLGNIFGFSFIGIGSVLGLGGVLLFIKMRSAAMLV